MWEIHFSLKSLSKQCVYLLSSIIIVAIGDTEIAEDFHFQCFKSQLAVAEDDVEVVVGDGSLLIFDLEHFSVPERKDQTFGSLDSAWVEGLLGVACEHFAEDGLADDDEVSVFIDVFVEVVFVVGVDSVD